MNKLIYKKSTRRKIIKILGLSAIGSSFYGLYKYSNDKKIIQTEWNGTVLNNPVNLKIHSFSRRNNNNILKQVNKFVHEVDNIFNLQNSKSEIVLLNSNKILSNPSSNLIEVIEKSKIFSEMTDGIFDITVQPLWNYYYNYFIVEGNSNLPDPQNLKEVISSISWKNVIIKDNTIKLQNNSSITLNGIAQGWVTDQIIDILKKNDIKNTLVDFGETYALGKHENYRPWNILLKGTNNINKIINLNNKAVATSSGSATTFEPTNQFHHIFNPKTGLSESKYETVSVVSDKAWISDSLATSALMLNKNELSNIGKFFNAEVFVQEKNVFKKV